MQKIINFRDIDVYPEAYTLKNDYVTINQLVIEDIKRQKDVINKISIGSLIEIDTKFGHFDNGKWEDVYFKGVLKITDIIYRNQYSDVLLRVRLI